MSALAILILLIVTYVAIVAATTLLSQPLRIRIQEIGFELLDTPGVSDADRLRIEWMMTSSMSSTIGMLVPLAAVFTLVVSLLGGKIPTKDSRIERHPKMQDFKAYYVLSLMACSPFAALLSVPPIIINVLIGFLRRDANVIKTAEEPALKAAAQFQPC